MTPEELLAVIAKAQRERATALDLSGKGITTLPPEIGRLTALTELNIRGNKLTALPPEIGRLTALTVLDLYDNELTALPPEIGRLTALTELDLGGNRLTALPLEITRLAALTALRFPSNNVVTLPPEIGRLTTLTELNIRYNRLTTLPPEIGRLTALTNLDLSFNQLTVLPPEISELAALTVLYLFDNRLTTLPSEIGQLTALTHLHLGGNQLPAVSPEISQLTALTELYLNGNQLTGLPPEVGRLTALTTLALNGNQLTGLPPEVGRLTALNALSLDCNQLTGLPPEVGRLTAVTWLHLSGNQLTGLPPEIVRLTSLDILLLDDNRLTALPPEIGRLTELTELHLSGNQLTGLPPEIVRLTSLDILLLGDNRLTALPPEIGRLTALSKLDLSKNQLTALPPEIGRLTALTELKIDDNPLLSPPPEICKNGTWAILTFLRAQLKQGSARQWLSKMVVVGEGGVGKTSLVNVLSGRTFNDREATTHGLRPHKPVELPHPTRAGVTMKLFAWDFGGQQIYHATHQFFLTDKALFLLVWNARLEHHQGRLEYWLDAISARAPDSPILIVATHVDERPAAPPPLNDWKRKYRIAGYLEISNKTGQGIDELKAAITRVAAALPLMGVECPRTWVAAVNKGIQGVQHYQSDPAGARPYLPVHELRAIVRRHGVAEDEVEEMLRWAHELGIILYFPNDAELSDTAVLNPCQVNADISKVLDHGKPPLDRGVFTPAHQNEIWPALDPKVRRHLLRLMERFDLSYRIPDTENSLVVARLPADPPDDWEARWNALRRAAVCHEVRIQYGLNTVPAGIPSWFLARQHRFSIDVHWRHGGLFADEGRKHLGLLRVQPHERRVELAVRGPYPQNFFALLKDGFEYTLARYPGLEVKRLIPCPCGDGRGRACAFQFDHALLCKHLEAGMAEVACGESLASISIPKLLFGWGPGRQTLNDEVLQTVKEGFAGQKKANAEMFAEMLALSQRQFLALCRAVQGLGESHCPNVFVLRPASQNFLTRVFAQKLELHLLCQEPGCWHPTGKDGRYTFQRPREWFGAVVPYLKGLVTVLRCAAPAAGMFGDADFWKDFSQRVEFMGGLLEQVPDRPDLAAGDGPARIEGAALRALRKLLDELDPKQGWGGLRKVLTPEGHYLWLCPEHAARYAR